MLNQQVCAAAWPPERNKHLTIGTQLPSKLQPRGNHLTTGDRLQSPNSISRSTQLLPALPNPKRDRKKALAFASR